LTKVTDRALFQEATGRALSIRRITKMQKFRISGAFFTAALLAAGASWAEAPGQFRGAVKLADPSAAPAEARIVGVDWRCAADGCVGEASRYTTIDSVARECRQVAAVLGSVTAYASRGVRLSPSEIAACNHAAAPRAPRLAQN
jgi:hypothetical protein